MTPAERDLDKLMEECRAYAASFPVKGALEAFLSMYTTGPEMYKALWVAHTAFPAGARARLEALKVPSDKLDQLAEASRLVAECEALQRGESE